MKIGELARAAGVPVETIRYYEREGLLPRAPRTEGNYRVYGPAHIARLTFVRHCRSLDMALDEIRVLLRLRDDPAAPCDEANAVLDAHLGHVSARIRELRQLERQLKVLRAKCAGRDDAAHCGILQELARAAALPDGKAPAAAHGAHPAGSHGPRRP